MCAHIGLSHYFQCLTVHVVWLYVPASVGSILSSVLKCPRPTTLTIPTLLVSTILQRIPDFSDSWDAFSGGRHKLRLNTEESTTAGPLWRNHNLLQVVNLSSQFIEPGLYLSLSRLQLSIYILNVFLKVRLWHQGQNMVLNLCHFSPKDVTCRFIRRNGRSNAVHHTPHGYASYGWGGEGENSPFATTPGPCQGSLTPLAHFVAATWEPDGVPVPGKEGSEVKNQ